MNLSRRDLSLITRSLELYLTASHNFLYRGGPIFKEITRIMDGIESERGIHKGDFKMVPKEDII